MKSPTMKQNNVLERVKPLSTHHETEIQPYGRSSTSRLGLRRKPARPARRI